jgi:hypothetical protein
MPWTDEEGAGSRLAVQMVTRRPDDLEASSANPGDLVGLPSCAVPG